MSSIKVQECEESSSGGLAKPSVLRVQRYFYPDTTRSRGDSASVNFMNTAFDAITARALSSAKAPEAASTVHYLNVGAWVLLTAADDNGIEIEEGIHVTFADAKFRDASDLESAVAELRSTRLTCGELVAYVTKLVEQRVTSFLSPSMGAQFVFDLKVARSDANARVSQYVNQVPEAVSRMQRIVSAPRHLSFNKTPFRSNKAFGNLFGAEIKELERRVRFFLENKQWYADKGVPYQLGVMLSGACGTGKSSAIRAIANLTRRHIVNVNIANVCTSTQLRRLFFSDDLHVLDTDDQAEGRCMHVPVHQRLYVLEEIDAVGAGQVLLERLDADGKTKSRQAKGESLPDEVTLGEILQIFDGNVEAPGRIVVVTTNHPEALDRSFVRPGRIDIHISFGQASREAIADLYASLTEEKLSQEQFDRLPDRKVSPAVVAEIVLRNLAAVDRSSAGFSTASISNAVVETLIAAAAAQKAQPKNGF